MSRGRSIRLALVLGAMFVAAMAWAGWDTMKRAGGMTSKGMTAGAFVNTAPGASARLVVEVLGIGDGGELRGRLLEKHGGAYRLTSVPVTALLTAASAIVMGSVGDIGPRAVLQLSGRFDDRRRVRVARAVVLTGYVKVER